MTSIFRSFLVASAVFATFAAVQPSLHAQGFGGAFSSFFSDDVEEDNSPVDVSASIADIYLEKNIITLYENVVVDRKDTKITCDKMEIFLKNKSEEADDEKETEKPKETKPEVKPSAVSVGEDGKAVVEKEEKKDKDDGMNQNISKLVCTGDVVYRQKRQDKPDDDSLAMAAKGDYDETTGIIVMTGGHMNPKNELSETVYNDIVRVVGKKMVQEYPIMKQGNDWILGDKIEIFVKDRNHMRVINPKATISNTSKSGSTR